MQRKIIVVGDAPASGGAVLPYEGSPVSTIDGHRIALVGGRVMCAACNSIGHIAKAGGSYRPTFCGAEQVLEGDVVVCECAVASPLVSRQQSRATCCDRSGVDGYFSQAAMGPNWYRPDLPALMRSKKIVDAFVKQTVELGESETICPGVSDEATRANLLKQRDRAVYLIRRKIAELDVWDSNARDSVFQWFGENDENLKRNLRTDLVKCTQVLEKLKSANFVKYSESVVRELGCISNGVPEDVAAVCHTDIKTHTILIKPKMCGFRDASGRFDSKVAALIHESTHFLDTFIAKDTRYGFDLAQRLARTDPSLAQKNSDNIAGYVVWNTHADM